MTQGGTVTRTIRIDTDTDRFLREFSDKEGVSVNFLVNRALRRLVEWDVYAERFGIMALPAAMVTRMMQHLTEEEAADLGRWVGKYLLREFLTFWFKEVNLQTLVLGFPRLSSQYGKAFEYEEHVDAGRWTIILKHGNGMLWSIYYETLLKTAYLELVDTVIVTEKTENQVVARFSVP